MATATNPEECINPPNIAILCIAIVFANKVFIGLTSANDALSVTLLAPSKSGLQSVATFYPKFTYPIFGEEEKIFGYKGLKINLRYRANDMRPHLKISHGKKFKSLGDQEPDDIAAIFQEGHHLPKGLSKQ
jgi:histone acetyltransferase 1